MPLAESRGSVPCGVWGNAPTVPRATSLSNALNKGAGSEASLPVTSRSLRSAPKLLYRPTVQCRAKWARPHSLPAPISANKTQPEDSQHPPALPDPSFAHLPYTKFAPEASTASGAKIMRKKCERDRKPSSVEGRSSIQTWRCRAGSSDAEDATGSRMCPHTHLAPDGVYSTDKSPSRG